APLDGRGLYQFAAGPRRRRARQLIEPPLEGRPLQDLLGGARTGAADAVVVGAEAEYPSPVGRGRWLAGRLVVRRVRRTDFGVGGHPPTVPARRGRGCRLSRGGHWDSEQQASQARDEQDPAGACPVPPAGKARKLVGLRSST